VLGHHRDEHRGEERSDVDADVEDRKTGIAPRAALGVKLADRGAHVGLEQAHSEYVEDQPEEEESRATRRQQGVAGDDQNAARSDRELAADQPVRHPPAEEREQERAAQVQPPDGARALIAETQPSPPARSDQEQYQDRLNTVVSKALPHLREE